MTIKYYKDLVLNKEIQDYSGLKTIEQLKKSFNCPNLEEITMQIENELLINQVEADNLKQIQKLNEQNKQQCFIDNLPSWQQISDSIDNATTLATIKIIIKKLAKVVYWLARNSLT